MRSFCSECKQEFDISHAPETFEEVQHLLGENEGKTLTAAQGCDKCGYTGYSSRVGVFEVMDVNRELRNMIARGQSTEQIRDKAVQDHMLEFRQVALLQVARGITSAEEVFRVIPSEHLLVDD